MGGFEVRPVETGLCKSQGHLRGLKMEVLSLRRQALPLQTPVSTGVKAKPHLILPAVSGRPPKGGNYALEILNSMPLGVSPALKTILLPVACPSASLLILWLLPTNSAAFGWPWRVAFLLKIRRLGA